MALLVVQVCFGLLPMFVKLAHAGGISPQGLVGWRVSVGAVVFLGVAWSRHGGRVLRSPRELVLLAVCGVLGVLGNQVLALLGMVRSSSAEAGLIMTLIPVFTFGLAAAVGQERFQLRRAVGIPIALVGALLLLVDPASLLRGESFAGEHWIGNSLMATNCLLYAGFLVLSRRLLRDIPPLVLVAWSYLFAALAAPVLLAGEGVVPDARGEAGRTAWWALAYILVLPTVLAYGLNTFALARVPASVTAIYIYLQPLVAVLAGVVWLDEELGPALPVSAALLFVGIGLVTRPGRTRRRVTAGAPGAGPPLRPAPPPPSR